MLFRSRLGRMADTLEYSSVALPLARLDHALVRELEKEVPSLLEYEDDKLVIKHLYIERRMNPLNLYLQNATPDEMRHALNEYGLAIKQLARTHGRLVMGPDCGTAIVGGVPLGFANQVRRGRIGLVGASGTGLQEVKIGRAHV